MCNITGRSSDLLLMLLFPFLLQSSQLKVSLALVVVKSYVNVVHAGADIIICDEGHVLKNDSSALSKCVNKVQTRRRIVLTGTPLQNNLIECELLVAAFRYLL